MTEAELRHLITKISDLEDALRTVQATVKGYADDASDVREQLEKEPQCTK
jgi:hypothetical protein